MSSRVGIAGAAAVACLSAVWVLSPDWAQRLACGHLRLSCRQGELADAVAAGDEARLQHLLASGQSNARVFLPGDIHPMVAATRDGCGHGVVSALLRNGARMGVEDEVRPAWALLCFASVLHKPPQHGNSPLHLCLAREQAPAPETIALLRKRLKSMRLLNDLEESPLHVAASYVHCDALGALLGGRLRKAVNQARKVILHGTGAERGDGATALFLAARHGRAECTDALLRAGADPNIANRHGHTPLMEAVIHNRCHLLPRLLAGGAQVDLWDLSGMSALAFAAWKGRAECAEALLAAGADVNLNADGSAALLHAARAKDGGAMVRRLLAAGADINVRGKHGYTPLLTALANDRVDNLDVLLQLGADASPAMDNGLTAIDIAIKRNLWHLVQPLARSGARLQPAEPGAEPFVMVALGKRALRLAVALAAAGAPLLTPGGAAPSLLTQLGRVSAPPGSFDSTAAELLRAAVEECVRTGATALSDGSARRAELAESLSR